MACQFTQPMSTADACLHTSAAVGWQRYYLTLERRLCLLFVNKFNQVKFITEICTAATALGNCIGAFTTAVQLPHI